MFTIRGLIDLQLHLGDAIPFLVKTFERAIAGPAEGSAYSRYYILETARLAWKDVAAALAKVMYKKGIFTSPKPRQVSVEDAGQGEVKYLVAANMLVEGNRAAEMGFKATHPSMLVEMEKDLKDAEL